MRYHLFPYEDTEQGGDFATLAGLIDFAVRHEWNYWDFDVFYGHEVEVEEYRSDLLRALEADKATREAAQRVRAEAKEQETYQRLKAKYG